MSYTKNHAENQALRHVFDDMVAIERRLQRERLERLAWEAKRALNDYTAAVEEFERSDANRQQPTVVRVPDDKPVF